MAASSVIQNWSALPEPRPMHEADIEGLWIWPALSKTRMEPRHRNPLKIIHVRLTIRRECPTRLWFRTNYMRIHYWCLPTSSDHEWYLMLGVSEP